MKKLNQLGKKSKILSDCSEKENLKMQFAKGEIVNDIELIPLQSKPMILIGTQIDDVDVPNKLIKKQQELKYTRDT